MGKNQDNDDSTRTDTSPTHKIPLTPTKDHPLMDLVNAKPQRSEFMDSDSDENMVVLVEEDDAVVDCSDMHDEIDVDVNLNIKNNNNIENSQISNPPPPSSSPSAATESEQIVTTSTLKNVDDDKNNNTRMDMNESDEEAEKQQQQNLTVDKVVRRRKSPSRVNNNNIKNNNRMSYPMGRDRSQPSEVIMSKSSSEKIDGKS